MVTYQEIAGEKQCSKCGACKLVTAFRPNNRVCRDCQNAGRRLLREPLVKRSGPLPQKWSSAEDAVIATHYATGGVGACMALLPGRSESSIRQRACRLRETTAGSAGTLYPRDDAPIDSAFMAWRYPVEPVQLRAAA